jgi:hypothetical protein
MSKSKLRLNHLVLCLPLLLIAGVVRGQSVQEVPKTWDDAAIDSLELPLVVSEYSPVHVRSDFYYAIPIRPIYKSYPAYAPGKEPRGYLDWLKQQEPAIAFDPSRLHTIEDWAAAGELVFEAPIFYDTDGIEIVTAGNLSDPAWYKDTGTPIASDGTVPFVRYFVRKKGVIEVGQASCGMCHTRVMADGAVLEGGQGNFPFDRAAAYGLWSKTQGPVPVLRLPTTRYVCLANCNLANDPRVWQSHTNGPRARNTDPVGPLISSVLPIGIAGAVGSRSVQTRKPYKFALVYSRGMPAWLAGIHQTHPLLMMQFRNKERTVTPFWYSRGCSKDATD